MEKEDESMWRVRGRVRGLDRGWREERVRWREIGRVRGEG